MNKRINKRLTQAELARKLSVHRSTIAKYVRLGMTLDDDGRATLADAARWVRKNINVQVGRAGAGVRGAARVEGKKGKKIGSPADPILPDTSPDRTRRGSGRPPSEHAPDLGEVSVRLLELRCRKLEAELEKMRGGTDFERVAQLNKTLCAHLWWCLQAVGATKIAADIADAAGRRDDRNFKYAVANMVHIWSEYVIHKQKIAVADALAGRLEPVTAETDDIWQPHIQDPFIDDGDAPEDDPDEGEAA